MSLLNLGEVRHRLETIGEEIGFITKGGKLKNIDSEGNLTHANITRAMLIGGADGVCFPLVWLLKDVPRCASCNKRTECKHCVVCERTGTFKHCPDCTYVRGSKGCKPVLTINQSLEYGDICMSKVLLSQSDLTSKIAFSVSPIYSHNEAAGSIRVLYTDYDYLTNTHYAVIFADSKDFEGTVDFNGFFAFVCKLEPDIRLPHVHWVQIDHSWYCITDAYLRQSYKRLYDCEYSSSLITAALGKTFSLPTSYNSSCYEADDPSISSNPLRVEDFIDIHSD